MFKMILKQCPSVWKILKFLSMFSHIYKKIKINERFWQKNTYTCIHTQMYKHVYICMLNHFSCVGLFATLWTVAIKQIINWINHMEIKSILDGKGNMSILKIWCSEK